MPRGLTHAEQLLQDVAVLADVGRMYLDALDIDPANEMLTLLEAVEVTAVREAVEHQEARHTRTAGYELDGWRSVTTLADVPELEQVWVWVERFGYDNAETHTGPELVTLEEGAWMGLNPICERVTHWQPLPIPSAPTSPSLTIT